MAQKDPYELAARFNRFLRVTDVTDGLDAVGRADLTLLDPAIRPLWMGMQLLGPGRHHAGRADQPAACRSSSARTRSNSTPSGNKMGGWHADAQPHVKPGCVIVTSTGGAGECGYWGSNNSMGMQASGVVGIVTDGYAATPMRSSAEVPRGLPRDRADRSSPAASN